MVLGVGGAGGSETVCVHSDTTGAPEIFKAVRDALDLNKMVLKNT